MYNPDWLRYCKRVVRAGLGTDHLLRPERKMRTAYLGSAYGGWVVAVDRLKEARAPLVLSFGLGDDISFDEAIIREFGATVYGFDPTTPSLDCIARQGTPKNMQVLPIGISDTDGQQTFYMPAPDARGNFSSKASTGQSICCKVMRYRSLLDMLRIDHVDVLKLDVEGSEYDVIPEIVSSRTPPVQLLIEFHHRHHGIHVSQTRKAVDRIRQAGFTLFAVSPAGQELSFIRQ